MLTTPVLAATLAACGGPDIPANTPVVTGVADAGVLVKPDLSGQGTDAATQNIYNQVVGDAKAGTGLAGCEARNPAVKDVKVGSPINLSVDGYTVSVSLDQGKQYALNYFQNKASGAEAACAKSVFDSEVPVVQNEINSTKSSQGNTTNLQSDLNILKASSNTAGSKVSTAQSNEASDQSSLDMLGRNAVAAQDPQIATRNNQTSQYQQTKTAWDEQAFRDGTAYSEALGAREDLQGVQEDAAAAQSDVNTYRYYGTNTDYNVAYNATADAYQLAGTAGQDIAGANQALYNAGISAYGTNNTGTEAQYQNSALGNLANYPGTTYADLGNLSYYAGVDYDNLASGMSQASSAESQAYANADAAQKNIDYNNGLNDSAEGQGGNAMTSALSNGGYTPVS